MTGYDPQSRFAADAKDQDDEGLVGHRRGQIDRDYGAIGAAHQMLLEANRALINSARARTALLVGNRGSGDGSG